MAYRDQKTKEAFIKYLQQETDERFFQALSNFTGIHYIGSANTPDGQGFRDLFHVEADQAFEFEQEYLGDDRGGPDFTED